MTPTRRFIRPATRARGAVAVGIAAVIVAVLAPNPTQAIPAPPKPILNMDTKPLEDDYITTPGGSADVIAPAKTSRRIDDKNSANAATLALRVQAFLLRFLFNPLAR